MQVSAGTMTGITIQTDANTPGDILANITVSNLSIIEQREIDQTVNLY